MSTNVTVYCSNCDAELPVDDDWYNEGTYAVYVSPHTCKD